MKCSFAVNLLVVIRGGARGFTLRSYGDVVHGEGACTPFGIGAPFPVCRSEDFSS